LVSLQHRILQPAICLHQLHPRCLETRPQPSPNPFPRSHPTQSFLAAGVKPLDNRPTRLITRCYQSEPTCVLGQLPSWHVLTASQKISENVLVGNNVPPCPIHGHPLIR